MEWNKTSSKDILQYAVGPLLYVPASNNKIAYKINSGEFSFVKSLVLDLEDSLGDTLVSKGIENISNIIQGLSLDYTEVPLIFIRVREPQQINKLVQRLASGIKYITGFVIPKFNEDKCGLYIHSFLKARNRVRVKYGTELYLMPIIESSNVMSLQSRTSTLVYLYNTLRGIEESVLNIRVGGADFCSLFGVRRGIQDTIYDIGMVRSVLNDIVNVFGKSYVVSAPVWEYFVNKDKPKDKRWLEGLKRELYADKLNGFIGKTVIHPSQVPIVQESLIVSKEDYEDAISILNMNPSVLGVEKSVSFNRMNEVKTHTNWAKKILGLSQVYGVREAK